uniref:Uncharacterized protein n=1 Tax=Leersia perrieri TaxID=77586 RepID=A0A0D9WXT9_9ORYZ
MLSSTRSPQPQCTRRYICIGMSVTRVAVSSADFFITGSADATIEFMDDDGAAPQGGPQAAGHIWWGWLLLLAAACALVYGRKNTGAIGQGTSAPEVPIEDPSLWTIIAAQFKDKTARRTVCEGQGYGTLKLGIGDGEGDEKTPATAWSALHGCATELHDEVEDIVKELESVASWCSYKLDCCREAAGTGAVQLCTSRRY